MVLQKVIVDNPFQHLFSRREHSLFFLGVKDCDCYVVSDQNLINTGRIHT